MRRLLMIVAVFAYFAAFAVQKNEHKHEHEKVDEHSGVDEHEDKKSAQVGPDKGILAASQSEGFKLSPEAEKNFGLSRTKVSSESIELPKSAIVTSVAEINVFRYRNGFYKRVEFSEMNRSQDKVRIRSKEIRPGDEIVIKGLGFLRIAEIAAFGGAPEGHSH